MLRTLALTLLTVTGLALIHVTPDTNAAPLPQATPTSVATPVATPPPVTNPLRDGFINLEHLQRLTEVVEWEGTPMALVHIYSEAPDYEWVDASGEGIAAVDDVARAALVYLLYYERTGDEQALDLARASLNFTLALQHEGGEYYNFVYDRDGTINTDGITSYLSWNWWAARGQWALAMGYRVFRDVDPAYAETLHEAYLRGEEALREQMGAVGSYDELHGERVPAWLIHNGSDLSALAVLGLAEYYAVEPNPQTRQLITNLANAVAKYQLGGPGDYPFDAQPSASTSLALWHAWGSHQVHALAVAGDLLGRDDWIRAAQRTADHLFMRLLATDFVNEMAPLPQRRGQIAYGTQVITSGFWSLHQATGDEGYARAAGLSASWLFGNNMAGVAMYDPETGLAFDGIDGPTSFRINRNAGAESTIEALYTLLLVGDDPIVNEYLRVTLLETPFVDIEEMENGERAAGAARYGRRDWTGEARFSNGRYYGLSAGDAVSVTLNLPAEDEYLLYAAHLRRAAPEPERVAEAVRAPDEVVIDGELDEWDAAQPLLIGTREQLLRGGAAWPGVEVESFSLRWMWDDENLYVAADVRDPEHSQTETGPSVWRGDVIWLYLDTRASGSRLDVKLTLAETADGPQIWNWIAGSFLPNAELVWQETENGYVYEAALPLDSLNFLEPETDAAMNFEAGMGFTGGFLTWTGLDPDTASNLAPLTFADTLSPAAQSAEVAGQSAEDVAFSVTIATASGLISATVPQATSPDRDYLWLDRVFDKPVALPSGESTLRVEYAGLDAEREAIVDAFLIVPAVACKTFEQPNGDEFELCHDMLSGETAWRE